MTMSLNLMLLALAGVAVLCVVSFIAAVLLRKRPVKLDKAHFQVRWRDLQKNCADKSTWPMAIIDADKLLDEALKRRHYRGKTMGERLVSAQRDIVNNDSVWFGHKLRNKIVHEEFRLNKTDVKRALEGFMMALKDLGAL